MNKTHSADCADEGQPIRAFPRNSREPDCVEVFEFLAGCEDFDLL
jgi:hypothetical protein